MNHRPLWMLGEISPETCDLIKQDFMKVESKAATMGEDGEHLDNQHRNTTVRFIPPEHPLTEIMLGIGLTANKECGWDYLLSGNENVQFAEYAVGQHYRWHTDTFTLGISDTDRKVTVVCLLSDPSEYEGGEFFIRLYQDYKPELKKGSIIAFPSILEHTVTTVTKGVRYSAAMWINGPRFR